MYKTLLLFLAILSITLSCEEDQQKTDPEPIIEHEPDPFDSVGLPVVEFIAPLDLDTFMLGDLVDISFQTTVDGSQIINDCTRLYIDSVRVDLDTSGYAWLTAPGDFGDHRLIVSIRDDYDQVASDTCTINLDCDLPEVYWQQPKMYYDSVWLAGKVISDGGSLILEKGFYWNIPEEDPTEGRRYVVESESDDFSLMIRGVGGGGYYKWAAFTVNEKGEDVSEITGAEPSHKLCPDFLVCTLYVHPTVDTIFEIIVSPGPDDDVDLWFGELNLFVGTSPDPVQNGVKLDPHPQSLEGNLFYVSFSSDPDSIMYYTARYLIGDCVKFSQDYVFW